MSSLSDIVQISPSLISDSGIYGIKFYHSVLLVLSKKLVNNCCVLFIIPIFS